MRQNPEDRRGKGFQVHLTEESKRRGSQLVFTSASHAVTATHLRACRCIQANDLSKRGAIDGEFNALLSTGT